MTDRTAHRAAALGTLARVRDRYREGRAEMPDADWNAWRRTIGFGIVGMMALMVVLMLIARGLADAGSLDWEPGFLLQLEENGPFRFSSAVFFQTFGTDITLVILVASTAGIAAWMRRPVTALSIILAPLVTDLVGRFGWMLWDRARPDILHDGIASPGLHSFPSGHSSKAFATYGFLIWIWIRASESLPEKVLAMVVLIGIGAVVPTGRLVMGVHWPSDVIGGLILGAAWLAVLAYGLRFENSTGATASASRAAR